MPGSVSSITQWHALAGSGTPAARSRSRVASLRPTLPATCLCDSPAAPRVIPQGDWRSSRPHEPGDDPDLRQSGSGEVARSRPNKLTRFGMKLRRLVVRYITHRRSLGERCQTNASILRAFCGGLRRDIDLKQVGVRQTTKFLYGKGPVTSAWYVKHNALKGFFRYVISRDYGAKMPLPAIIPQRPPPFVAYIYSREELRHLLQATKNYQRNRSCMEPETMRVVVLLLYATGLRVREAVALNRADVDFDQSLLTVVKSKFYKSRLVPFSPRLGHVLQGYLSRPTGLGTNVGKDTPFFTTDCGNRVNQYTVEDSFRRICQEAGVRRRRWSPLPTPSP